MDGIGGNSQPQSSSGPNAASNKKLQQTQAQVDEVVGIMRVNVEKVLERDKNLSELDTRAEALRVGANKFETQAGRLKRKMWWKNLKMMILLGTIAAVILILIIIWLVDSFKSDNSTAVATSTTKP